MKTTHEEPRVVAPAPVQDYVKLARELGLRFAERTASHDRTGEFPHENFSDLTRSGYTAMTVPARFGGGEVSLEVLCRAQEVLAASCASTAFAVNMHIHGLGMLNLIEGPSMEWAYREIVHNAGVIAGGFSEPGVGGNWWYPTTTAMPVSGGYLLTGKKGFFTGYPAATLLFLTAAVSDERGLPHAVGFLIPRPEHGVRVTSEWDACGMRATGSHSLELDRLFVDSRYQVGKAGEVPMLFMKAVAWAWCSFASVFVGIAGAALEHVCKTQRERTLQVIKKPLAHLPGIQFRVAEMRVKLEAARAQLYRAARTDTAPPADPIAHYVDMCMMKMTVCQLAHEVVTLGLQVEGGSGYVTQNPMQRLYRDVTAGLLVPPASDVTLEWAGKHALGIPVLGEPRWGE